MNKILMIGTILTALFISSCGSTDNKSGNDLGSKKAELEKLKSKNIELEKDIKKLEDEIAQLDPASQKDKARLVTVMPVIQQDFTHYIDLQGRVDANDVVIVTPRGMPAQVRETYVKRGDMVTKGQLLLKLDDAIIVQQMDGLKTQLSYAQNIYNRQKNLWDQGIGTEVQLISAKNSVDALEKQMASLQENWKTSFVYSPISGVADIVNIKTGEIFSGATPTGPQLQIVNSASMKVVTEVPENYQTRVRKGSKLKISIPDAGIDSLDAEINVAGLSITPTTRGFTTEARIPSLPGLRLNQVALVHIKDYSAPNAITVPVNVVQTDEKGKYVYIIVQEGDVSKARKKQVNVGEIYNGMVEVKSGLTPADKIITEGYQSVYDGQVITTEVK